MNIDPSAPANPTPHPTNEIGRANRGLTKREWLIGIIAAGDSCGNISPEQSAIMAIRRADAIIEQLNKESEVPNG